MYKEADWLNWLNGIEFGGGIGGLILCCVDESTRGCCCLLCCPIILINWAGFKLMKIKLTINYFKNSVDYLFHLFSFEN